MSQINIKDSNTGTILDTIFSGISPFEISALYDSIISQMEYRFPFNFKEALQSGEISLEIL